jgi:hypothetical protein
MVLDHIGIRQHDLELALADNNEFHDAILSGMKAPEMGALYPYYTPETLFWVVLKIWKFRRGRGGEQFSKHGLTIRGIGGIIYLTTWLA